MAIKKFKFDYDSGEASAAFSVDTDIFTEEMAKGTLEFFLWDYDELNDPIEEVMYKYAMEAIETASKYSYNTYGVKKDFENKEGFCKVDGSLGITLLSVSGYKFEDRKLELEM